MANTDRFIDEVTEEVRRDRLYRILRRWGWLGALIVLLLVGGAAWNEYRNAQNRAAAEAFGDALIAAFDTPDAADRMAAFEGIETDDANTAMILALLRAGEDSADGDDAGAAARLRAAAEAPGLDERYRDLALFKAHLLDPLPSGEAAALLDRLARPGAPYRALALEQQAYQRINAGDLDGGIDLLRQVQDDAFATAGLQQRAMQLIVALEAGSTLSDTPVEPVETEGTDPVETGDGASDAAPEAEAAEGDAENAEQAP